MIYQLLCCGEEEIVEIKYKLKCVTADTHLYEAFQ